MTYQCRVENYHAADDWGHTEMAFTPQSAAEQTAEWYDQDDHGLMRGHEIVVYVKAPDGAVTLFQASGEAVANYYAVEKDKT